MTDIHSFIVFFRSLSGIVDVTDVGAKSALQAGYFVENFGLGRVLKVLLVYYS